jgi:hypothetical protein
MQRAYLILGEGRRAPCNVHLISEEKGDAPMKHASRISRIRISLLLNMHKKEYLHIILHRILLVPTRNMPVGTHTHTYVCQPARAGPV